LATTLPKFYLKFVGKYLFSSFTFARILTNMYTLTNKVVVITGASSGIGKALAETALQRGAKIAVCARNVEKLKSLFTASEQIFCFQADVSQETDCKAFMEAVVARWGEIDVLINNAGISMRAIFEDVDLAVIRELMDVNFWGAVYCTKYALPLIMKNKGVIVGISSIAGNRGLPGRTGYSSSKFALQGFLESLRTELLQTGVNVLWAAPGFTASNIRKVSRSSDGTAQAESPLEENKLMTAEECARIIIGGIEKRKRTIVMTGQGKLVVWLNKLLPGVVDNLVYKHFMEEPGSPLKKYEGLSRK